MGSKRSLYSCAVAGGPSPCSSLFFPIYGHGTRTPVPDSMQGEVGPGQAPPLVIPTPILEVPCPLCFMAGASLSLAAAAPRPLPTMLQVSFWFCFLYLFLALRFLSRIARGRGNGTVKPQPQPQPHGGPGRDGSPLLCSFTALQK